MKKLFIVSAIAMSGLVYTTASAQIRFHFGLRFHPRVAVYAPAPVLVEQAPVHDQSQPVDDQYQTAYNDNSDDYYYLPDIGAYFDITDQCYYYNDGNAWISAAYLPGAYHNYDWRNAPRYEIRASRPYMHDDFYRSKYNSHASGEWAHNNNHFDNGYANRAFNGSNQRFDNRAHAGYNQPEQQHLGWGAQSAQPNMGQGGYGQPEHQNRGRGSYGQPAQPGREQQGNQEHSSDRGRGGNTQPSNQNGSHSRDTRGGDEHLAQNNPQAGSANRRMARF